MKTTQVPDTEYWKSLISCQYACPVHTDARGYVRAIAEGHDELAYLIARGPNPMASICGRVCGAPCETACRRGDIDKPISIRALKRYVTSQFGPEARPDGGRTLIDYIRDAAKKYNKFLCQDKEELLPLMQATLKGNIPPVTGQSVGIIGSGPAGLSAAHDLALFGFEVTIYEMDPILAGMLVTGVPEYRLPRALIEAEVEVITEMGVKSVTNCTIGKDITLPELRKKHDAVIIAVGMKKSRNLPLPGSDAEGVLGGVEYLREILLGKSVPLGSSTVVIGGGNVAYDVGRTIVRQTSMDTARTALRESTGKVYLCSLESEDDMPADDMEIIEGDEEGVLRRNSMGPQEILLDDDGKVRGVRFKRCLRVFDENHRFSPIFDDDDIIDIACENVLICIGQSADLSFIDAQRDGLVLKPNGLIDCNPETGVTAAPDLYVAGDLAYGAALIIHAVASGKAVARQIYKQVTGNTIVANDTELHFPTPEYSRENTYETIPRVHLPTISPEERIQSQFALVEQSMSPEVARREASRCLDCGVNTIFDGSKCVLCGGCADVCPELCLQLVSLTELVSEDPTLKETLGVELDGEDLSESSAIIKDETRCIRCALCAERCPTGAITMEQFQFKEEFACQDA